MQFLNKEDEADFERTLDGIRGGPPDAAHPPPLDVRDLPNIDESALCDDCGRPTLKERLTAYACMWRCPPCLAVRAGDVPPSGHTIPMPSVKPPKPEPPPELFEYEGHKFLLMPSSSGGPPCYQLDVDTDSGYGFARFCLPASYARLGAKNLETYMGCQALDVLRDMYFKKGRHDLESSDGEPKPEPHWTTTPPDAEHVGRWFWSRISMTHELLSVAIWDQEDQDRRSVLSAGYIEWWSEPIEEPGP